MSHEHAEFFFTAEQLCHELDAELIGDGSVQIAGVNSLDQAGPGELSFVTAKKFVSKLKDSKASVVLVSKKLTSICQTQLLVDDVNASLIKVLNLFAPKLTVIQGVHSTAVVEDSAVLGQNISIGANVYIGHSVKVGSGCVIGANASVGENSTIGDNTRLDSGVVIYHNCKIGNNCVVQANSTIGGTGFGYSFIDGQHQLIPHNGGVIIEDCVEIGTNSCVDRAKFGNTIIGAGTKVDNFVQIAHNCVIGKCCLFAGYVAIAGSSHVGNGVIMGGMSGSIDNITIGDGVIVGAGSNILTDIPAGERVLGVPAKDAKLQIRIYSVINRLPKMYKQLREVVKKVKKLETSENNKK
jgi:UDP-3-O-[3-hydroxymyristoyl] glucosamine N-acyltransferase